MILNDIVAHKKRELDETKANQSLEEVKRKLKDVPSPRDFYGIFNSTAIKVKEETRIIAEIKKASPSKGLICHSFDPLKIGHIYAENGAAALSVLTESRFFQGDIGFLHKLKSELALPLLRKDFIFDEYQVYESLLSGADALLLIARILDAHGLRRLILLAHDLNLAALVEVHSEEDLEKTLSSEVKLIGINNRDLETFAVDLNTTISLLPLIPEGLAVISESGISRRDDILELQEKGVNGFLIGEALLREKDKGKKLQELIGRV